MKKVYVLCPGGSVTGGPELIHQFIDVVNNQGGSASVIYYPFDTDYKVPDAYQHYNVKVMQYNQLSKDNSIVIIPEVSTSLIKYFSNFKIFIWWLSIDNYLKGIPVSVNQKLKSLIKKIINHKSLSVKIEEMSEFGHLVQSYYAKEYLSKFGYQSDYLSDYLNENHFNQNISLSNKKDIICYNPKKGINITQEIMKAYPNFNFTPIINMTSKQVATLLSESKIYIDFGSHPGKDRIPREAAMAKCIVITGMKGSAKNKYDIAVPEKYKIDETSSSFVKQTGELISEIFNQYETNLLDFNSYIKKIEDEEDTFVKQVYAFMDKENLT